MSAERAFLGLNGATIPSADLQTGLNAAKEAGFSYYEPRISLLLDYEANGPIEQASILLRESGLSWLPLNAVEGLFSLEQSELLSRADEVFSLATRFEVSR